VDGKTYLMRCNNFVIKCILMPNMFVKVLVGCRSRYGWFIVTEHHHFWIRIFYVVVNIICVEMNHWFGEASIELLVYFLRLDRKNLFFKFDINKACLTCWNLLWWFLGNWSCGIKKSIRDLYALYLRRHHAFLIVQMLKL
jgi:hypothetical protein